MKKFEFFSIIAVLAVSLVIFSCEHYNFLESPTSYKNQDDAQVIKYSSETAIEGKYIVVFKEDGFSNKRSAINANNFAEAKKEMKANAQAILKANKMESKLIEKTFVKALRGVALGLTKDEVNTLKKDTRVAYIEQDQVIKVNMGGPPSDGGGDGGSDPQVTPWGITRVNGGVSGEGKVAYIIDTGIDASHPDLNVDVSRGFNAFGNGPDADLTFDGSGHGTHVAGTVAAIDNEIGVIGVAAGATVVPVKVLDRRGSGSTSGVIAGIDFVSSRSDCDAANMSLGGGFSQALNDAVVAASSNCPFALAAGNESTDANTKSPASANGNNIYTVSSMAEGDEWSYFSNYSNPPVDFCAPGSAILSTYKGDGYATLSGTSMASPHVCGILLLGNVGSDGTVNGDPDNDPDPIAVH